MYTRKSAGTDSARRRTYRPLHAAPRRAPRKRVVLAAVLAVVLLVAAGVGTAWYLDATADVRAEEERMASDPVPQLVENNGEVTVEDAVDFDALQQENPEIYAWITVPGTNVNQPVLQSATDDEYYLEHDRTGAPSSIGAVFSQSENAQDFSDPVTVLYGHDVDEPELMFRSLHNFEDETFFNEHREMYVYLPGRVLVYEIVAAYQYDDRHILNSFDFSDEATLQAYFDSVMHPDALLQHVREGVELNAASDKILQLSTCMLNEFHGSHRFIVTGVLRRDEAVS